MGGKPVVRVDPKLVQSIEQFRLAYSAKNGKVIGWPEATGLYAECATTPLDDVAKALKRIGTYKL